MLGLVLVAILVMALMVYADRQNLPGWFSLTMLIFLVVIVCALIVGLLGL